jgi:hypothetical protein
VLQHLKRILAVYETVVRTLKNDGQVRLRHYSRSASYGNVWDVILGFELLLSKLEDFKQLAAEGPDTEQFRIGINLAWEKLDKYYQLLDETPIYYTALALHPAYQWDWFEEVWSEKPEWIEKAKSMVRDIWREDYSRLDVHAFSPRDDDGPPTKNTILRSFCGQ